MLIKRQIYNTLLQQITSKRNFIQVIAGARQIGKSTLVRQVIQSINMPSLSITADDVTATNSIWINQQWEAARLLLKNSGASYFILAIDEIQKINNWSEAVKKNWDADTANQIDVRVIITGSSKLLLQKGLTESLAGRFELIKMTHWSFAEMQQAFDINEDQYAYFGAYPAAAELIADENRWRNYIKDSLVETTISKDILLLNRIDKPALLKQLFEVGCAYSTQQISYNKLLGQLQNAGNTTTLSNYLGLLDSANLLTGLQKYSGAMVNSRNSSPKLQVYNNALFTLYNKLNFIQAVTNPGEWGKWVESCIGTHLINSSIQYNFMVYYWRDGNEEVDFILQKNDKLIAIEVKSGNTLKSSSLEKANKKYNFYKTLLVGVDGLFWKDFIKININDLFE